MMAGDPAVVVVYLFLWELVDQDEWNGRFPAD